MISLRIVAALLVSSLIAACAAPGMRSVPRPHSLTVADGFGEPSSLNPILTGAWPTSVVTSDLALAFFFREGRDGRPEPYLLERMPTAASGDIARGGRRITFHLRPHLRWSDGTPLTSDDVAFTVAAVQNPKNNVTATGFDDISRVEVPDASTVVFDLKKPFVDFATFFFSTDGNIVCLLPRHAFKGLDIEHAAFNSLPVGAGPFRVTAWHRGSDITFERNPYYFGSRAALDSVVYKIQSSIDTTRVQFQTGEVQLWDRIPETRIAQARDVSGARVLPVSPDAYFHLDFNLTRVPDATVRRAVRFALDRERIAAVASGGMGRVQEGVLNEENPLASKLPRVAYDRVAAIALLHGRHPTLQLAYTLGDAEVSAIVEVVRAQLAAVGITLATKGYDSAVFFSPGGVLERGNWDLTLFNWTLDATGDIPVLFACGHAPPLGSNVSRYCNRELDALTVRGSSTFDPVERATLIRREEEIIDRDVPTIVLFMRRFGYATRNGVTGFTPRRDSPLDGFERVDAR